MKRVLPEGTAAGLKGANSSVGGCRPCEGSRVLAGEAGVCGVGKGKETRTIEHLVREFITSQSGRYSPTER